jgi:hypothetical protein
MVLVFGRVILHEEVEKPTATTKGVFPTRYGATGHGLS